jgi:DNA polymerase/3'-5' exonuclease PolX
MYFTGSMMFNRAIRHHAGTLGLLLSDLGVVPRMNREGVEWSQKIPICYTEKDIFDLLSLPYKSPP